MPKLFSIVTGSATKRPSIECMMMTVRFLACRESEEAGGRIGRDLRNPHVQISCYPDLLETSV